MHADHQVSRNGERSARSGRVKNAETMLSAYADGQAKGIPGKLGDRNRSVLDTWDAGDDNEDNQVGNDRSGADGSTQPRLYREKVAWSEESPVTGP